MFLVFNQAIPTTTSRRQCLTCLCSTMALIVAPGLPNSDPKAIAMDGNEKAVCRNCRGSGAIICECKFFYITWSLLCMRKTTDFPVSSGY